MSRAVIVRAAALALALVPALAGAKGGAYRLGPHGNRATGVFRIPGVPRGECSHCHGAPRDALGQKADGQGHHALFARNENSLCLGCHASSDGTWLGEVWYERSGHASSPFAAWPGPDPRARDARDAGKCVNCHDPHGVKDAAGLVPELLRVRPVALCLGCHRGNPAADVDAALSRTYRHPLLAGDPEAGPGAPVVATLDGGTCGACHNPHASMAAGTAPAGGAGALAGVARVRAGPGAPGSRRPLSAVAAGDPAPVREHEVCYRCHTRAAARPAAGRDIADDFNPASASFHPVEARGRNAFIDRRAFTPGWSADRQVTCSDCHASEDGLRGPHGSSYPHLLKGRHLDGAQEEPMLQTDLCFACHAYATYGDPLDRGASAASRFVSHGSHVGRGIACARCHASHGSAALPALLQLRSPGLLAYRQDRAGGSCTVSCHLTTPPAMTYVAPYPR